MMYYQKSSEFVDDENMDCGLQGSKKLFAQSPSGSDTALPKGVNYQAEEVPSDLESGLNRDKRLTTLAPPVARTVPTTESVAVVKGGITVTLTSHQGFLLGWWWGGVLVMKSSVLKDDFKPLFTFMQCYSGHWINMKPTHFCNPS